MKYQLASRREEAVTVDGLGVLQPGETYEVDEGAAEAFRLFRGLSLPQVHLPEGVELTVVLDASTPEEGN